MTVDPREYLKKAATAVKAAELRSKALEAKAREPIAIVSMACRFPGGVETPEELWRLLAEGVDAIEEFPAERWDLDSIYDPDPDAPGKSFVREGGFLRDVDRFDAGFFGIAPREAVSLDPQQRLLLETAWEVLERASVVPEALHESVTGVYVGLMYHDYGATAQPEQLDGYVGTGSAGSVASGRLAYTLGLQGPAMTVDTACSSSLVTLHLACQALRAGECDLALAGGVTVMATPATFIEFSRLRGLSPTGRCKSFSDGADGVGWSEGCGMLLLKRLSDAERDGDRILAVIRGTAVNQDGRSQGLTAPNGPSQERVIKRALEVSGLGAADIDYVEAHGTGTTLGDPIEANALIGTYGRGRSAERPLYIGSLKSNIGHAQAAAGVAGVMKVVLSLQHGELPRTLHAETPSRHVDWEGSGLALVQEEHPWSPGPRLRRAGVSSFGISGTNAHVILEEAPRPAPVEDEAAATVAAADGPLVMVLSGRTDESLWAQASRLRSYLEAEPTLSLGDVASSLATRRTHFERRASLVLRDRAELLEQLSSLSSGAPAAGLTLTPASGLSSGKLAFLFTGQGSQRAGMGKGLYETNAEFRSALDECASHLDPELERPLLEVMFAAEGSQASGLLDQTGYTQAALFALEWSLYRLWTSWGVKPDVVMGHSVGELAAAAAAGVFSLADGCRLVAARGRLMQALPAGGAMVSVEASVDEVRPLVAAHDSEVSLAAVNGPRQVVISGQESRVLELASVLAERGLRTKRLTVSHAFHSPLMEPMLEAFAEVARTVEYRAPAVPMVSNRTGRAAESEVTDPMYWVGHVREAVRFAEGVQALEERGVATYLELGPQPVLSGMALECVADPARSGFVATLRASRPEPETLLEAVGSLHVRGRRVDWRSVYGGVGDQRVPLPTYAFDRQRYWLEGGAGTPAVRGLSANDHPLLGFGVESAGTNARLFVSRLSRRSPRWMKDHAAFAEVIASGTTILEMCRAALVAARPGETLEVADLVLMAPLSLPDRGQVEVQVEVSESESGTPEIEVYSRAKDDDGAWTLHATATSERGEGSESIGAAPSWPPEADELWDPGLYATLAERGLAYGPAFRGVQSVVRLGPDTVLARVALPAKLAEDAAGYGLHPALLDAAMHPLAVLLEGQEATVVPAAFERLSLWRPGRSALLVKIELERSSAEGARIDVELWDADGAPVARLGGVELRAVTTDSLQRTDAGHDLYELKWQAAASSAPLRGTAWAVVADEEDAYADALVAALRQTEARAERLTTGSALPSGVERIVRLWPAGSAAEVPVEAEGLAARGLVELQTALSSRPVPVEVVWVTRGAVSIGDSDKGGVAALWQSALWGLARSARSEHPELGMRLVDIGGESPAADLVAALQVTGEPEVAVRRWRLWVPRLVRAQAAEGESAPLSIRPDGTVLVTGGLGALGLHTSRWLIAHGARRLLLTSRRGLDGAGAAEVVAELEALGARVEVAACDVSDRAALAKLLASLPAEAPLRGVVHCAGVLDDGVVGEQTAERLSRVMRPKVSGGWHLHELTRDLPVELFVLYSSSAGVVGAPGQSNYAAANSFLDQLAHHRRAAGLPALSLSWGAWSGDGMASDDSILARMASQGFDALSPARALSLLGAALSRRSAHQVPWALRRKRLSRTLAAGGEVPAMWRLLVEAPKVQPGEAWSSVKQQLALLSATERRQRLLTMVREEVAQVLRLRSANEVAIDQPLQQLGLDSLMAVELRNRLAARFASRLPATLMFDYPTVEALSSYLLEQALKIDAAPAQQSRVLPISVDEPIAIVSMACRFPGGVETPEGLWRLLAQGVDAIEEFPAERWDVESIYDPDPEALGKSYVREGGFLRGIERFDASFFGIAPREAVSMDPQQRLLLETAWEVLERAGVVPEALHESVTGVYIGLAHHDYGAGAQPERLDGYVGTGSAGSVASGRLAYTLGLQGPAMTVDTACSSSLVSLHLACQALRGGECDLALAGGVTVMATPFMFIEFSRLRGLSPAARCKSFSDGADGASWSEGCGMLLLKRLGDAERDGDRILAVVRGTAVNQDGRSQGLTAPNGPSQERVIKRALEVSGLGPADIDYVEAHGTGTTLGDPIEANALIGTYGRGRSADGPLYIGSLKSNIGHTQAAAGVAGVMKVVLSLQEEQLPRTLHAETPSRHVDWEGSGLALLQEERPWPRGARVRRAGASSFGISGTNAHVILEEAPRPAPVEEAAARAAPSDGPLVVVLSGRTDESLRGQAERLRLSLEAEPELALLDVAYSLATRRTHFERRASLVMRDRSELLDQLSSLSSGEPAAGLTLTPASGLSSGKLAFLFTGQGSQRAGMGRGLYDAHPVFCAALDECARHLDPELERPLLGVMFAPEGSQASGLLDQTGYTQAALFALEWSLYRLWTSWGVKPDVVMGHSVGELAAAAAAGVFSLADGCRLVAARGRLMQALPAGGAMVSVEASAEEVRPLVAAHAGEVSLAAVNGPRQVVISGQEKRVLELASLLAARGLRTKRLTVSHAFHSPLMEPMLAAFAEVARTVEYRAPSVPMVSNRTGRAVESEVTDPMYWVAHVREAVRFAEGVQALEERGVATYLELGPQPVLSGMALECVADPARSGFVATLRASRPEPETLLEAVGSLHVRGHALDWTALFAPLGGARPVSLPTYAFDRHRYWLEGEAGTPAVRGLSATDHPLLGLGVESAASQSRVFITTLSRQSPRWLKDHVVFGEVVASGTTILEMCRAALVAARPDEEWDPAELTLVAPLVLPGRGELQVQVEVSESDAGGLEIEVHSRSGDEGRWTLHATATAEPAETAEPPGPAPSWPDEAQELWGEGTYEGLAKRGLAYGPAFRCLESVVRPDADTLLVRAALPKELEDDAAAYGVHPALLDAALHAWFAMSEAGASELALPFSYGRLSLWRTGARAVQARLRRTRSAADGAGLEVELWDQHGAAIGRVTGDVRVARPASVRPAAVTDQDLYQLSWRPVETGASAARSAATAVVADEEDPHALALVSALRATDASVELLPVGGPLPERIERIVRLWPVGGGADIPGETQALAARGLAELQAALAAGHGASEIVWVTRGAIARDGDEGVPALSQSALWGLARSARSEHPQLGLRLIDVGAGGFEASEFEAALEVEGEPEVAIREGRAWAPRLVRGEGAPDGVAAAVPADGTILVTGGLGALGLHTAGWLVERGARRLLLTSRRGLEGADEAAHAAIDELRSRGAEVDVAACDVAERAALVALLASLPAEAPLRGVVHCAGVLDDGVVGEQTAERLSRVMQPKVSGGWHLHELTQDLPVELFVLYSSAAGIVGSPGQSNYAAANSFLDQLAHHRRAAGLPALSLSWGAWSGDGMASDGSILARMASQGFDALSPARALSLLDAALSRRSAHQVPWALRRKQLSRALGAGGEVPALWRELVKPRLRGSEAAAGIARQLALLASSERRERIVAIVREVAAQVLGLRSAAEVPVDQELKLLGLDSLTAVELRNRLSERLGMKLTATFSFDYPSVASMAGRLVGVLEATEPSKRLVASVPAARPQLDEPIAIVSMACRFPGGVETPEELWRLLAQGVDAIDEFPAERWDVDSIYDPDPEALGKSYVREGGFLRDVDRFDAGFFGIAPREAVTMDPQHRLLLETTWEVLERAGVVPEALHESVTGVYVGLMYHDYAATAQPEQLDGYVGTGSAGSVASGRLAYTLGLQGPAMTVDTACSSSLVSLHLACQALRGGECDLALAGGVTVMAAPTTFIDFSRLRGLSPTARCKSFSDDADGVIWSEGCGMLLLKRLGDAERDGDRILAVVRGTAVNQDGRSQGLTAPNGPSQERVIKRALEVCGLGPADIDYVEAHGTGTTLGDPIEANALIGAYGGGRSADRPLYIGSLKSNIGHAQAAAGVGAIMKVVLSLQHEQLPRTLHAETPSRHVDWEGSGLALLQEERPWSPGPRVRRAGASSFGISGTNAHIIIEEAPRPASVEAAAVAAAAPADGPLVVVLSGRTDESLRAQASRLRSYLDAEATQSVLDVAYSLATRRTHFERRASLVMRDRSELLDQLSSLSSGEPAAGLTLTPASGLSSGKLAFLFTGQGSQRAGMGRGLYDAHPVFRAALDECARHLDPELERPLLEVMFAAEGSQASGLLDQTGFTQAALFALEWSLYQLWTGWGIKPDVVMGHSVGELVAAAAAGVFSLADGCRLVAARGRLMQALPAGGAMVSVEASVDEVRLLVADYPGEVSLAAVNGPRQVVISGQESRVLELASVLAERGLRTKRLTVSHAFHSPLMEPMLAAFAEVARTVEYRAPSVPMVSNRTGGVAESEVTDPMYWVGHVREAVRFAEGVQALEERGVATYLELGPQPVLSGMALECVADPARSGFVASLRARRLEPETLLEAVGSLHARGRRVDWGSVYGGVGDQRVSLPTYAFDRQRYWLEGGAGTPAVRGLSANDHPLLGFGVESAASQSKVFVTNLSRQSPRWLKDHVVFGEVIASGTTILEMCGAAVIAARPDEEWDPAELTFVAPLVLPERGELQVQVEVSESDAGALEIEVHSRSGDEGRWTLHAMATAESAETAEPPGAAPSWPDEAQELWGEGTYERIVQRGLAYGPAFRCLESVVRLDPATLLLRAALPKELEDDAAAYGVHPALLDAALHAWFAMSEAGASELALPFSFGRLSLWRTGARAVQARLRQTRSAADGAGLEVELWDQHGAAIGRLTGVDVRVATPANMRPAAVTNQDLYQLSWRPVETGASASRSAPATAVVADEEDPDALALVSALRATDASVELLSVGAPLPDRVERIVRLWPVGSGADIPGETHALAARGLAELQEEALSAGHGASEIVWVTRGAIARDGDEGVPALSQSALWGLARSARSEHPQLGLRLIDVGAAGFEASEFEAALELEGEPELAIREGRAWAPRLVRGEGAPDGAAAAVPSDGTILVTGGLGALGLHTARWLAERGARRLLLTSRRGLEGADEAVHAAIDELRSRGADVDVAACDAGDRAALVALLASIPAEAPLRGVVHCAGVVDDVPVLEQTPERLARVMSSKVSGGWYLHELTQDLPVELFVLYSSASAVLPSAGLAAYAASNAFLDQLAHQRRARGLAAVSLSWGVWSGAGVASERTAEQARMARLGFESFSPRRGIDRLEAALATRQVHLVPYALHLPRLAKALSSDGTVPALWRELVKPRLRRSEAAAGISRQLALLPASERRERLVAIAQEVAAQVLGVRSAAEVPVDQELKLLGLDSVTAVELRNRLSERLGMKLPATFSFDYPSVDSMASRLVDVLEATEPSTGLVAAVPAARPQLDEPIAIVSMACRFPGGVETPEGLWRLLAEGVDAIEEFPPERWDVDSIYDPDPEAPGKSYVREGGFLRGVDRFDASFFGIAPREAVSLDPQQRLLLETTWEVLERAGVVPETLHESVTGVYVGLMYQDYGTAAQPEQLDGYVSTGSAGSVASGRLSYTLGLQGPAMTVDTACSSSLVTLHLACQALRAGECDLALAGGATVMSTPTTFIEFSRLRGVSPVGRCKSFSDGADGVSWSEGCGMLLLKRLSDAKRDGDRILAVVRGTAVNQDGRSQGLTAPNGPSQERVIKRALEVSGLGAADIDYVEAHGTGTTLGDPIEANALIGTYGRGRSADRPLYIGSLKSNIGHAQAAAGVAGVMKVVLSLQHGELPRTLHAETPSRHVDWEDSGLALVQEERPWSPGPRLRRAGVSSFGISGTNAHVILEEAPRPAPVEDEAAATVAAADGPLVMVLSGRTDESLRGQAERLRSYLEAEPELSLGDVASSLATRRTHFERRASLVLRDRAELLEQLSSLSSGAPAAGLTLTPASGLSSGKLAFLFTGQGSQRAGMGRGLYEANADFRSALDECAWYLDGELERPLLEVMFAAEGSEASGLLDQTGFTQAALFALEWSLYGLLTGWGVKPDVVMGHSVGELAAAAAAGVFSLADGCRLVAARGRLMQALPAGGAMVSVEASAEEVRPLVAAHDSEVSLAAVNGPRQVVISGQESRVLELASVLAERGLRTKRLTVSHAFHSPLMEPMLEAFAEVARTVEYRAPAVPMVSNRTGRAAESEVTDPQYWVGHVREAVRFAEGVQALEERGVATYLELGPQPVLSGMALECVADPARSGFVATLRARRPEPETLLEAVGSLHTRGRRVDWGSVYGGVGDRRVPLPTYAFDRHRFWLEREEHHAVGSLSAADHPLLGIAVESAGTNARLFVSRLSRRSPRWMKDHAVFTEVIASGTTILEMCRAALVAARPDETLEVADLTLVTPLLVPERAHVNVQVEVSESESRAGVLDVRVYSRAKDEDGAWTLHATATSERGEGSESIGAAPSWPQESDELWDPGLYATLAERGLAYGPAFRGTQSVVRLGPNTVLTRVALPAALAEDAAGYGLHPALLDAAMHPLAVLLEGQEATVVPAAFERLSLWRPGRSALLVKIELERSSAEGARIDVELWDADGAPVARLGGVELRAVTTDSVQRADAGHDLYELKWQAAASSAPLRGTAWAVVADEEDAYADALVAALRQTEARAERLTTGSALPSGVERIVRLWPAGSAAEVPVEAEGLAARGLAELQTALSSRPVPVEVVWVTRGAVSIGDSDKGGVAALWQSALWGLARSARSEHPELGMRLVDIGGESPAADLVAALQVTGEPEVAVRRWRLWVPRLVRAQAAEGESAPLSIRPDGTVLVTGGLGALGLHTSRWLIAHGARRLLLTSRRGLDGAGAAEVVAELEALGARVEVAACDVSDRAALAKLLAALPAEAPLRGVVHCAGVLDDGVVGEQTAERLSRVMQPKVSGGWHLHELTRDLPVELFVLYSSSAGVVGSPGQSNYAAANSFLDQLAHHRRAAGLPALSLSWGAWSGDGMASDGSILARMASQGFDALSPARALSLLDAALSRPSAHQVPWALRRKQLSRTLAAGGEVPAMWRLLVEAPKAQAGEAWSSVKQQLALLPATERRQRLLTMVREEVAQALRLRSANEVPIDQPLQQLGLDSLMAVELRNRLAARFASRLPATLTFDYPTVEAVTEYMSERLGVPQEAGGLPEAGLIEAVARAVANSSVAQLEQLGLLKALQQLASLAGSPDGGGEVTPTSGAQVTTTPAPDPRILDRTLDDALDQLAKAMSESTK